MSKKSKIYACAYLLIMYQKMISLRDLHGGQLCFHVCFYKV